jgi:hypothetical protein
LLVEKFRLIDNCSLFHDVQDRSPDSALMSGVMKYHTPIDNGSRVLIWSKIAILYTSINVFFDCILLRT